MDHLYTIYAFQDFNKKGHFERCAWLKGVYRGVIWLKEGLYGVIGVGI